VLVASITGDKVCAAWGIHHINYHIAVSPAAEPYAFLDAALQPKIVVASALFGLASLMFVELTHSLQIFWKRYVRWAPLRPMAGGAVIIALVFLLGTRSYLGIGVEASSPGVVSLLSAFTPGGAEPWTWWWKLIFTAVTLSCGFKGGEVTPLFFIGAALGHTLAVAFHAPVDLFAGLGFIGVFAAATNTPVACTLMGIELFGGHYATYFGIACFVAYFFSGHSGIYASQRLGVPKNARHELLPEISLREAREWEGSLEGLGLARLSDRWLSLKRLGKINGSTSGQKALALHQKSVARKV
jgi:H+/Cl- antiporter ClcA